MAARGSAAVLGLAAASLSTSAARANAEGWSWLPWGGGSQTGVAPSSVMSRAPGRLYIWGGPLFGRSPRLVDELPLVSSVAVYDNLCVAVTPNGEVHTISPSKASDSARERPDSSAEERTRRRGEGSTSLDVLKIEETGVRQAVDVAVRGDAGQIVILGGDGSVSAVAHKSHVSGAAPTPARKLGGALRRANIVKVRCSARHCAAVASDGSAYAWGDNSHKQLGQQSEAAGEPVQESEEPLQMRVPAGAKIVDADCGDRHTVLVAADGAVYACGDNKWAQLGVNADPWISANGRPSGEVRRAACVDDLAVDSVSCGAQHTIGLVRDGTPWSWGENSYGQLGHHNFTSFAPPNPPSNYGLFAAAVRCGRNHSCLVTREGGVWCIGDGVSGQLGSGTLQRSAVWRHARKLPSDIGCTVSNLAAGGDTTAVIVRYSQEKDM